MSRKASIKKHLTFFPKLKDKTLVSKGMVFKYLRVYARKNSANYYLLHFQKPQKISSCHQDQLFHSQFPLLCFMGTREFKFSNSTSSALCSALCNTHLQDLKTGTQDYLLVFWSHSLPNHKTIDTLSAHLKLNSILFYSAVQLL